MWRRDPDLVEAVHASASQSPGIRSVSNIVLSTFTAAPIIGRSHVARPWVTTKACFGRCEREVTPGTGLDPRGHAGAPNGFTDVVGSMSSRGPTAKAFTKVRISSA